MCVRYHRNVLFVRKVYLCHLCIEYKILQISAAASLGIRNVQFSMTGRINQVEFDRCRWHELVGFEGCCGLWFIRIHMRLKKPPQKNLMGWNRTISVAHIISMWDDHALKCSCKMSNVAFWALWHVAPFCWNQMSVVSILSNSGQKKLLIIHL